MENSIKFEGIEDSYFFIGEMTAFCSRFQAVADKLFEDISWKQCFVLICIKMFEQPPTINELSEFLGSSHQNVKQLLLKLQKLGYIEFVKDKNDMRKQRIFRTKKAEEFEKKHENSSNQYMKKLFNNISLDKLRTTIETLLLLAENLENIE